MSSNQSLVWVGAIAIAVFAVVLFASSLAPETVGHLFNTNTGLIVGMSAGLFGAAFSMLTQSQRRVSEGTLEDLDVAAEWHTLAIRGAFGIGGATILYFFFNSGLLAGSLWPDLNNLGTTNILSAQAQEAGTTAESGAGVFIVPNKDFCLLIIWCFIAGFSENFVPNILVRTENRTKEQS